MNKFDLTPVLDNLKDIFYTTYLQGKRDGLTLALNHIKENVSGEKKDYLISLIESLIKGYEDQM